MSKSKLFTLVGVMMLGAVSNPVLADSLETSAWGKQYFSINAEGDQYIIDFRDQDLETYSLPKDFNSESPELSASEFSVVPVQENTLVSSVISEASMEARQILEERFDYLLIKKIAIGQSNSENQLAFTVLYSGKPEDLQSAALGLGEASFNIVVNFQRDENGLIGELVPLFYSPTNSNRKISIEEFTFNEFVKNEFLIIFEQVLKPVIMSAVAEEGSSTLMIERP